MNVKRNKVIIISYKDDIFDCIIYDGSGKKQHYTGNRVSKVFHFLNDFHIRKFEINDKSLSITSRDANVIIYNYHRLFKLGYFDECPMIKDIVIDQCMKARKHIVVKKRSPLTLKKGTRELALCMMLAATIGTSIGTVSTSAEEQKATEISNVAGMIDNDDYNLINDSTKAVTVEDIPMNNNVSSNNPDIIVSNSTEEGSTNYNNDANSGDSISSSNNASTESSVNDYDVAYLDYVPSQDDKIESNVSQYMDIINKYSAKWGISPNTIKAMMSQESGGDDTNLMQIQFSSWNDYPITCYNFETNQEQTIVLTDNPDKYKNNNCTCITRDELNNPITNISVASAILAYTSKYENGHIGASIQAYNFGISNMAQVLDYTASKTGVSVNDILADQTNLSFMNYTRIINVGDPDYLIHVLAHTTGDEVLTFQTEEEDNDSVQILPKQK